MTEGLSDNLRAALSEFVTARLGLRFPPDRWDDLEEGARAACQELGITDVSGWVLSLLGGVPTYTQLQTLANQLTIGETYFFRHDDVFRVIGDKLLPELIQERSATSRTLRLWSAASSTGEEPYSLAILLRERVPDLSKWHVTLLATDINSRSLAKASKGVYSEWSFRDAPPWLKPKYFKPNARGLYELSPRIREMVRFFSLNLVDDVYPQRLAEGGFDFIFCRNVLIYFSAEWQDEIIRRLSQALTPNGYLVLGPCDTAPSLLERFAPCAEAPSIYRKITAAREQPSPPPLTADWWEPATQPVGEPEILWVPPAATKESTVTVAEKTSAQDEHALADQARHQANLGHLDQALRDCDAAVAQDKLNAGYHFLRGCILQEMNAPGDAMAAFRRVLFLDPDFVMAHFALGALARQQGRLGEATAYFREASRLLGHINRGDAVPGSDGLTAGRLQAVIADEIKQAS